MSSRIKWVVFAYRSPDSLNRWVSLQLGGVRRRALFNSSVQNLAKTADRFRGDWISTNIDVCAMAAANLLDHVHEKAEREMEVRAPVCCGLYTHKML